VVDIGRLLAQVEQQGRSAGAISLNERQGHNQKKQTDEHEF
jgi:hypothetical protein